MKDKYNTLSSKNIYSNPYWDYYLDKYIMPSGDEGDYHYVKSRGATMVVPLSISKNIILTKQFRYLNQKFSIEFPGGGIQHGLNALENAEKELLEETGYISRNIKKIGEFNPFNGVTNEICSIFVAKELTKSTPNPDESEEIEILELTPEEINDYIVNGKIWDGMTLAAWSLFNVQYHEGV